MFICRQMYKARFIARHMYKAKFIANSSSCTTTELSKEFLAIRRAISLNEKFVLFC